MRIYLHFFLTDLRLVSWGQEGIFEQAMGEWYLTWAVWHSLGMWEMAWKKRKTMKKNLHFPDLISLTVYPSVPWNSFLPALLLPSKGLNFMSVEREEHSKSSLFFCKITLKLLAQTPRNVVSVTLLCCSIHWACSESWDTSMQSRI